MRFSFNHRDSVLSSQNNPNCTCDCAAVSNAQTMVSGRRLLKHVGSSSNLGTTVLDLKRL